MNQRVPMVVPLAACLALLIGVPGCSFHLLKPSPAPRYYGIPTGPSATLQGPPVAWHLSIDEPGAGRDINTDRILLRTGSAEVKYFGGVRWVDRAPRLVQARVTRAFDGSGRVIGVARGTPGIRTDYKLIGELRDFSVRSKGDRSKASVSVALSLQLVRISTSGIVAARTFEESAPADSGSMEAVAHAFGAALDKAAAASVAWAIAAGEADFRARARPNRAVE